MCLSITKGDTSNKEKITALIKYMRANGEFFLELKPNNNYFCKAKKDIKIFKVLYQNEHGIIYTPYQHLQVTLGSMIRTNNFDLEYIRGRINSILNPVERIDIYRGLHSFFKLKDAKKCKSRLTYITQKYDENDCHKIYKAIIPKGSYYILNQKNGEIVSDQIKILEQLCA